MTTHYTDLEVPLHGLTFIVTGTYSPEEPATEHYPGNPAEFEIHRVSLERYPHLSALDLLEEFRGKLELKHNFQGIPYYSFESGLEQLEQACLAIANSAERGG